MSLFSALNVAISGLDAQSASIGNISDNLANASTVGYKTIGTTFSSLVTSSTAASNSPGGVSATPDYQNSTQGTIAATDTTTNLAISGDGCFVVTTASSDSAGQTAFSGSVYYTRCGDFTLDKDGYMVNSAGYYLEGYPITGSSVDTSSVTPIQISSLLDNPEATTAVTYVANLPASASNYTSTASTIDVYDALGSTHQTSVTWETTGVTNQWLATVRIEDAGGISGTDVYNYKATFLVDFNSSAPAGTVNLITGQSSGYYLSTDVTEALTTDLGAPAVSTDTTGDSAIVYLGDVDGGSTGNLIFPGAGTQTINLNLGNYDLATGLTQYANASSTVSVSSISQDGLGEGSYSSIAIDTDGIVSINYTNGSTRKIYQIPVATFNSPENLQRGTGGVYSATIASGTANLHLAGNNGSGTIKSSSLEDSTVDIASEFTTMIEAQQVYSANAKIVSSVNSMLNTIIQAVQ
ncbi:MAG: flagellar hook-basal body complex protein [Bdellovibrionales bacterium]